MACDHLGVVAAPCLIPVAPAAGLQCVNLQSIAWHSGVPVGQAFLVALRGCVLGGAQGVDWGVCPCAGQAQAGQPLGASQACPQRCVLFQAFSAPP